MSLSCSRLASARAITALIQGIQNPATGQALFQEVKLGALFDPSGFATWAEIVHLQGKGGPAGSGGPMVGWRIDDVIQFGVTAGVGPYETDSSSAQVNMLTIQDVLLPALRMHFQLPDANNPVNALQSVYEILVEQNDRSRPARFPNGHVYLLWDLVITVKQQYNVELIQP